MDIGLQVGFGDAIGRTLLQEMKDLGLQMVRVSANRSTDGFPAVTAEELAEVVQEVVDIGMRPLVIIRDAGQIPQIPAGIDIEMGNEPNMAINGWREANQGNAALPSYVEMAMRAIPAAANRNPLWIACPRGLHRNGFAFLRMLAWSRIPEWVGCSIHRYPVSNRGPLASENKTLGGFLLNKHFGSAWTREDEVAELRRIVGKARPIGLSEIGYNRLDYRDESLVARHHAWEHNFWRDQSIDFAIAYQINDGDPNDPHTDAHYGFRRADGTWRPCMAAWITGHVPRS